MHDIEENEFVDGSRTMIYEGKVYTRGDFRNMERAINQVQKTYQIGIDKSVRYLQKNAEYNRTLRMISYYKNKKFKNRRDFERLEELQKTLDNIITEREEFRLEHDTRKLEKQKLELEKKKFEKGIRGVEDE